jgi:hypothetical protein
MEKTEPMTMEGGDVCQPILKEAYCHLIAGTGQSFLEKSKEKKLCDLCEVDAI